jgi:hypothetical protein
MPLQVSSSRDDEIRDKIPILHQPIQEFDPVLPDDMIPLSMVTLEVSGEVYHRANVEIVYLRGLSLRMTILYGFDNLVLGLQWYLP